MFIPSKNKNHMLSKHELTIWSNVLEKLIDPKLVKKLRALHHLFLFRAS